MSVALSDHRRKYRVDTWPLDPLGLTHKNEFLLANLAFIFSGATESAGKARILTVVLFGFLEFPGELVRPEKTGGERAVLFKVCFFREEILVWSYFLRDSSQPCSKEKSHGLKKSGYYYYFVII